MLHFPSVESSNWGEKRHSLWVWFPTTKFCIFKIGKYSPFFPTGYFLYSTNRYRVFTLIWWSNRGETLNVQNHLYILWNRTKTHLWSKTTYILYIKIIYYLQQSQNRIYKWLTNKGKNQIANLRAVIKSSSVNSIWFLKRHLKTIMIT